MTEAFTDILRISSSPIRTRVRGAARSEVRDTQRQKVYRWGETQEGYYKPDLSLAQCRALIDEARACYGLSSDIEVADGRGRRAAAAAGSQYITLPKWSRQKITVLHEAAHAICASKYPAYYPHQPIAPHGPEFMRIFIDLLERVGGLKGAELRRSARAMGVKVAQANVCPQPLQVREVKRLKAISDRLKALHVELQALEREATAIRSKTRRPKESATPAR